MPTRTKYRRSRTGIAFGGAFWRFDPASQTPGQGGVAGGRSGFEPPVPRVPPPSATGYPPNSPLAGLLAMGGSIAGASADGKTLIVTSGGKNYFFNAATGQQIATTTGGAGLTNNPGAPVAGPVAPTGASAPSSRVGTTVNGRTSSGATVTGTITGVDANGNVIVQWQDGTVTSYDSSGKVVSTQPPPGTTTPPPGTTDTGTTTPPPGTTTPPPGTTDTGTTTPPATTTTGPIAGGDTAPVDLTAGGNPPPPTVDPTALFFPPPNTATVQGTDKFIDPGAVNIGDAVTTTAPTSPYAPPPIPINDPYATSFDAGFTAPSTLDVAQTLAPPDVAPPSYPSFTDTSLTSGFVEPSPTPGVTDYVPPDQYAPPPDYSAFS